MLTVDPWFWVSGTIAAASTGLAGLLIVHALASPDVLRRHIFFVFFFTVVTIYLQLAPLASLAWAPAPEILAIYRIPPPQQFTREYAIVQLLCLLFFQLPLFVIYLLPERPRPAVPFSIVGRRGLWLAASGLAIPAIFLLIVARDDLWFTRLGADVLAQRIVALPLVDFLIFRSYQETGLFLVGVLFFAAHYAQGALRRLLGTVFALNAGLYGAYNLLLSRWFVASLAVCLGGWWLMTRRRLQWTPQTVGLLAGGLALTLYLFTVVINVRNQGWTGSVPIAALNPLGSGIFADTQGVGRLNCVDLMARMLPGIQEKGPSLGASWGQVTWLVRRWVDPEGFDRYRLTMATTAKSHLMQEYLDWELPDYFSCTATDLFGSFHVAGLLVGAILLAWLFRFAGRALATPRTGAHLLAGLFVLTQILIFDQEAAVMFFGWPRRLPLLLVMLLINPFVAGVLPRPADDGSAAR
jgi:hypothetical protein